MLEDLKAEARPRSLWNLFFPGNLSNVDYAPLAEIMGRSLLAPEACKCAAPDAGNMELRNLDVFGYTDREGHCEVAFDDVGVPARNLPGQEGTGFLMAQPVWDRAGFNTACVPSGWPNEPSS